MRRRACLNIDVDTVADHLQGYGVVAEGNSDPVWSHAVPRLLEFLAREDVRATFFVIGRDAVAHSGLVREIADRGHEVASHSMTHTQPFSRLTGSQRWAELTRSRELLSRASGSDVIGFKAPGWDVDRLTLELASAAGYRYDASEFPSPLLLAARLLVWRHSAAGGWPLSLADFRQVFRRRRGIDRAEHGLAEFPVATTRMLRLPVYNTMRHYLGNKRLDALIRRLPSNAACSSFTLHAVDFLDPKADGADPRIQRHPGMTVPVADRIAALTRTLGAFRASDFSFVRFDELGARDPRPVVGRSDASRAEPIVVSRPVASDVLVVIGTRPEAIKMAPVYDALSRMPGIRPQIVITGQHREMVAHVLELFGLEAHHDLGRDVGGIGDPGRMMSTIVARATDLLDVLQPALVLVQGDTTSALGCGLAAFYRGIPVGHVEAGLRTLRHREPFPEEAHRRMLAAVADLHFAPTESNRTHLLREGVDPGAIHVTGNTVIDSLLRVKALVTSGQYSVPDWIPRRPGTRRLLLTLHRRESLGVMAELFRIIERFARRHEDWEVVFPVHPNPDVRRAVRETNLKGMRNVRLLPPLGYAEFVAVLAQSDLVVTDSGGVQEETPALGVRTLVVRDVTERTELCEIEGMALVGVDPGGLELALDRAITDPPGAPARSAFGDGRAGERIAEVVSQFLRKKAGVPDHVLAAVAQVEV